MPDDQLFTSHGYVKPTRASGKGRRATTCAMPHCTNPRRNAQAAKYCDEHATSIDYVLRTNPTVPSNCYVCDLPCSGKLSTTIRLCTDHKYLRPIIKSWSRHHVNQTQARAWLTDPRCWICNRSLAWRFHQGPSFTTGSNEVQVDHDRGCCPGDLSCGKCIRGLAHAACNRELGHIEAFTRRVGTARAHAVIDAIADHE